MDGIVKQFLEAKSFAVAGASQNQEKYGYKVFRALLDSGRHVVPLNPATPTIDGHQSFASISDVEETPAALSIVTPPLVTRQVVQQAIAKGVKHIWMQPGAEDSEASAAARQAGINVIDDGSCILVAISYERHRK